MNIMVSDVAAENGGMLSILNDFYDFIKAKKDMSIRWTFILGLPKLQETESITVINFPWAKISWLHRLFFDVFVTPLLVKKHHIDAILSLQNVCVPFVRVLQTVYVDKALPFTEHKLTFSDTKYLWAQQKIIGAYTIRSIKKASHVIVQTKWMKEICVKKASLDPHAVMIISPTVKIPDDFKFIDNPSHRKTFFYPASPMIYKNHSLVLKSCEILKQRGINDYNVIFTLNGSENPHIKKLFQETALKGLNIKWYGPLPRQQCFELYSQSVLLFPSYIETVGLPMLEAKLVGSFVIASDCSFSHEILDDYKNANFFDYKNANQLADLMESVLTEKFKYTKIEKMQFKSTDSQKRLYDFITK